MNQNDNPTLQSRTAARLPAAYLKRFDYDALEVPLICWLDYEPADPTVGLSPTAWLVHAFVADTCYDIEALLPASTIEQIETEAACYFSEN